MNAILRWSVRSLFAPVTGNAGAVASTLGFFLAFLPIDILLKIALLPALSLMLRLNVIALYLGAFITFFIPHIRDLPILHLLNDSWLLSVLESKMSSSQAVISGIFGGFIGLLCYFFFHWFYNLGLKKNQKSHDHVFLDPAKRRWTIIKRMTTGFLILLAVVSAIFIESLSTTPELPELRLDSRSTADNGIEPINERIKENELSPPSIDLKMSNKAQLQEQQEVYAFYVDWDENSKTSFNKNKDSISTLIPEWLQLTSNLDLMTRIDQSIVEEAKAHNIKILPLVNNVVNDQWDGDALHRLFTEPGAQEKFINSMLTYVQRNDFDGINIDFEEIQPRDRDHFTQFMEKVYQAFHPKGLMVTVDVPPNNSSFDYAALAASADRMMVMLYDEHHAQSKPGPIASIEWATHSFRELSIPPEKLIISLGSYGYDWEEGSSQPAKPITFQEVMNLGTGTDLQIYWSKQAGNPYLRYKKNEKNHTIWFLDAATFYNQMKLAIGSGSNGIALWRLGSEDPAIWNYINQPAELIKPTDALNTLASPNQVHHTGDGEILTIASQSAEGKRKLEWGADGLIQSETYVTLPEPTQVIRHGKPQSKEIVLSFDDGPDPAYTPQILDILNEHQIKGTFFILGENALQNRDLIKRMHEEGHEIGSHTFTHPDITAITPIRLKMEVNATQRLFQEITGHSMTLFRPTYDADTMLATESEQSAIWQAQEMGYTMVGQSIDSSDWKGLSSKEIVDEILFQLPEGNVILFHDAGGDRSSTVEALPMVIKELKQQGYTFTTAGELIGKSSSSINPAVHEASPYSIYNKAVFLLMEGWKSGLAILFYSAILLGILRLALFVFLSGRQVKRYRETRHEHGFTPFVSVVIAAYNEEKVICNTIDSILASDYPNFEILIIDDGSTDDTSLEVKKAYASHPLVKLIQKANGGKSSAVNLGFKEASGEIVIALDADTLIAENAISLLVSHFKNEHVAAVSGNVKVGNKGNLLTNWQHIEYVTGFNLERRAFAALNCITVVPGAIGAWRKTAVAEAGYFQEDTLAEDTDLTLALLRNGKKIEFEEKAYAFTEVPEDVKSLAKQRYRWVYGTLQCLWKHRDALFNKKHGSLGFIALPNMWLFQYLFQIISPIAEILFVFALFSGHGGKALIGFILFYLLDLSASLYAFRLEKESPKTLWSLLLQRILYKQLMTYVVIKSLLSAIKGVTVGWGKLKRNGNATQDMTIEG
ncbi:polysaccharide deacetylase family protein [Bacillus sp. FJAT-27251]|uniref:polysaccharide deacetylase family protein n=1 Tax=Bacillus sp. FJAT-27251 TaxID=1684142 RepID=UPI0012E1CBCD|nr:polysaccharide deacetylase family protein [Bacillus sp. FJAT-27251]